MSNNNNIDEEEESRDIIGSGLYFQTIENDKYFPYKDCVYDDLMFDIETCNYIIIELEDNILNNKYKFECNELKNALDGDQSHNVIVLDLRSKEEYQNNHIFGSINFPLSKIGKSKNLFDKYVMKNHKYWSCLFGYSEHLDLVIYDNDCDVTTELKLKDMEKITYQEKTTNFEFFLHLLILYNSSKHYSKYGKKWRSIHFLKGGINAFCSKYPQHCNKLSIINNNQKQSKDIVGQDLMIIQDKLYLGNEAKIKQYRMNNQLEDMKLKCIIDLRLVPDEFPKGIMHLHYPPENILDYLINIVFEIDRIKDQLEKDDWIIYVFCETGHGLSAAVIVLYIMAREKKSLKDAYLDVYRSLGLPLIFPPYVFNYLAKREIEFRNKDTGSGDYVTNASLPPKFWYLGPYFESSITNCIEKVCPSTNVDTSNKKKCMIM